MPWKKLGLLGSFQISTAAIAAPQRSTIRPTALPKSLGSAADASEYSGLNGTQICGSELAQHGVLITITTAFI